MQAIPYLNFNGHCKKAMKFYQQCFGGTLQLQTVGASPLSASMPPKMKQLIVHASLTNKSFQLSGTDLIGDHRLLVGNHMAIAVGLQSGKAIKELAKKLCFEELSPKASGADSADIRNFRDRYGVEWLLYQVQNTERGQDIGT